MPNYYLIEERMMKPIRPDGIDVQSQSQGFSRLSSRASPRRISISLAVNKIAVDGLEDVLLAAGDSLPEVEDRIRGILTSRANELESIMGTNVQVIFQR